MNICDPMWVGFNKIGGTFCGGPLILRVIIFWGLHRGAPILGNYHIKPPISGPVSE